MRYRGRVVREVAVCLVPSGRIQNQKVGASLDGAIPLRDVRRRTIQAVNGFPRAFTDLRVADGVTGKVASMACPSHPRGAHPEGTLNGVEEEFLIGDSPLTASIT